LRSTPSKIQQRQIKFGHARFIACTAGAIFDTEPLFTSEDAEISLVIGPGKQEETCRKKNIKQALKYLRGVAEREPQKPLPPDMGERTALAIFRSLYKSDEIRLDYPERTARRPVRLVARALVDNAIDGDTTAVRECFDRMDGKVAQGVANGQVHGNVTFTWKNPDDDLKDSQ
jgi:hypothetical protein